MGTYLQSLFWKKHESTLKFENSKRHYYFRDLSYELMESPWEWFTSYLHKKEGVNLRRVCNNHTVLTVPRGCVDQRSFGNSFLKGSSHWAAGITVQRDCESTDCSWTSWLLHHTLLGLQVFCLFIRLGKHFFSPYPPRWECHILTCWD